MAQLIVRNLDANVKERLKERALRRGQSLEAAVREILEEAVLRAESERDNAVEGQSLGLLMRQRFGERGLTEDEKQRFDSAIRQLNSRSEMRIPDFGDDTGDGA